MTDSHDSKAYRLKKQFFDQLLTIYGRKPVLEALQDDSIALYKLHLADSNKGGGIVAEITRAAEARGIEIEYHDKKALSRISKNGKQDQGVAADIELQHRQSLQQFIEQNRGKDYRVLALDSVTNPQNLGMIIRSVAAGNIDGLLIPQQGCAALSPLVIKASTGTLFRAPLLYCDKLARGLKELQEAGTTVCTLSSHATESLLQYPPAAQAGATVFVLGNETEGVSAEVSKLSDRQLMIPMNNGVESLNVAITAALIAFQGM